MENKFHKSKIMGKEQLQALYQRSNQPALSRFLLMYLAFIAINLLVINLDSSKLEYLIPALLAYGIIVCSIFAAEHETVHSTAFKSKRLNQIGAFLVGLAHIYPSSLFRELHFTHHRYTHIPGKDPEISLGNRPFPSVLSNLATYLSWLSGFPLLLFKIFMIISSAIGMPEILRKNLFPFVEPNRRWKVFLESWIFILLYAGLFYLVEYSYPGGILNIILGQIIGHCFLTYYLTMEHNGLSHESENILDRTRSINTNKWVKLLMWNMPYHAEHHAYPAVPFHALPQLHEQIKPELLHKEEGHADFHIRTVRQLFNEKESS